jgi:hypothetical protein
VQKAEALAVEEAVPRDARPEAAQVLPRRAPPLPFGARLLWLRTNGVNTNGVTAKVIFLTDFRFGKSIKNYNFRNMPCSKQDQQTQRYINLTGVPKCTSRPASLRRAAPPRRGGRRSGPAGRGRPGDRTTIIIIIMMRRRIIIIRIMIKIIVIVIAMLLILIMILIMMMISMILRILITL